MICSSCPLRSAALTVAMLALCWFSHASAQSRGNLGMEWWQELRMAKIGAGQHDNYGEAVALSGDWALIGARRDDVTFVDQGSAEFWRRNGNNWARSSLVAPPDGTVNDFFGKDVAIDGDWAVIAAEGADHSGQQFAGGAYVYQRNGTNWQYYAKLIDPNGPQAFMAYANQVAISGDTIAVAYSNAPAGGNLRGRVDIFQLVISSWVFQHSVIPTDLVDGAMMGKDIALLGDTLVIGSDRDDQAAGDAGAVYVFDRSGGVFLPTTKLLPTGTPLAGSSLGYSVDIDGDRIAAGAPFGESGGIGLAGYVHTFTRTGGVWSPEQRFADPTPVSNERLGSQVRLSGDRVLAGLNISTTDHAQLFELDTGVWIPTQTFAGPGSGSSDNFGIALDIEGTRALIGASGEDTGRGAAYLFDYVFTTMSVITNVSPSPSQGGSQFSISFSISADSGLLFGYANIELVNGNSGFICTVVSVVNGNGSCNATLGNAGDYEFVVDYFDPGYGYAGGTSAPFSHSVLPVPTATTITANTPNPSLAGDPVTVSFSVVQNRGDNSPTGNVTVSDGVNNCLASVASGSCDITLTTAGNRMLMASYPGDSQYAPSLSAPVAQTVLAAADLTVAKRQCFKNTAPDFVHDYLIEVRNVGAQTASGVMLQDVLPVGVSFLSSLPASPTCTETSGTVDCSLADLGPGGMSTVEISVLVDPGASGTLTNTVSVSAMGFEPTPGNNSASLDTLVVPDLVVDRGFESCGGD